MKAILSFLSPKGDKCFKDTDYKNVIKSITLKIIYFWKYYLVSKFIPEYFSFNNRRLFWKIWLHLVELPDFPVYILFNFVTLLALILFRKFHFICHSSVIFQSESTLLWSFLDHIWNRQSMLPRFMCQGLLSGCEMSLPHENNYFPRTISVSLFPVLTLSSSAKIKCHYLWYWEERGKR